MSVIEVNLDNFEEEVLKSDKTVLIDFWAAWCGPCRMLGPIVDEVAEENDDIKVCKINVDENTERAARYGVMSIPNLVVIRNGKVVTQSVGVIGKARILELVK